MNMEKKSNEMCDLQPAGTATTVSYMVMLVLCCLLPAAGWCTTTSTPDGFTVTTSTRTTGSKKFEEKNHLASVQSLVADKRTAELTTGAISSIATYVLSWQNLYSGGSPLPNRSHALAQQRYLYQGSEQDAEIYDAPGTHITTWYRENSTRLVRWWSPDPKSHLTPHESPYASMAGNPVRFNDPLGDYIPTQFSKRAKQREEFDDKGVPMKVQQEFNMEYGIKVAMVEGNLMYDGDVEGWEERMDAGEISKKARNMWKQALNRKKDSGFRFNFDSFTTSEGSTFNGKAWVGPFWTENGGTTSYFNLKAIQNDGTLATIDYRQYPQAQNGRILRSMSFARVMEHELLHAIYPYVNHNTGRMDFIIQEMNIIRRQIGLEDWQRVYHRLAKTLPGQTHEAVTGLGIPRKSDSHVLFRYNMPVLERPAWDK